MIRRCVRCVPSTGGAAKDFGEYSLLLRFPAQSTLFPLFWSTSGPIAEDHLSSHRRRQQPRNHRFRFRPQRLLPWPRRRARHHPVLRGHHRPNERIKSTDSIWFGATSRFYLALYTWNRYRFLSPFMFADLTIKQRTRGVHSQSRSIPGKLIRRPGIVFGRLRRLLTRCVSGTGWRAVGVGLVSLSLE